MSAYLEFHLKDNRRAYVDAALIGGVFTSKDMGLNDIAAPDAPVTIMMRGGETFETIGQSPARILVRAREARDHLKAESKLPNGRTILVDFLESLHEASVEE